MITTSTRQNRKEYETALASKLAEWGETIDDLAARAETTKGELRDKLKLEVESLRQKRLTAKVKLDELQGATDAAWEDLGAGVERAGQDVRNALGQARARFGSGS